MSNLEWTLQQVGKELDSSGRTLEMIENNLRAIQAQLKDLARLVERSDERKAEQGVRQLLDRMDDVGKAFEVTRRSYGTAAQGFEQVLREVGRR